MSRNRLSLKKRPDKEGIKTWAQSRSQQNQIGLKKRPDKEGIKTRQYDVESAVLAAFEEKT